MNRALVIAALAASSCLDVAPEHRCLPNTDPTPDPECVLDGVQGQCELSGYCSFPDAACGAGRRYHDDTGDRAGICVVPRAGAIELPPVELDAQDDRVDGCGPPGAREVMYELTIDPPPVPVPQFVLVDVRTPDTTAPVAISIHDDACRASALGRLRDCSDPTVCAGSPYSVIGALLTPGVYCIVVEELDPAAVTTVAPRVFATARPAIPAPLGVSGLADTTGQPDTVAPSCRPTAGTPDDAYLIAMCPGQMMELSVEVAPQEASLDLAISVRAGLPYDVAPELPSTCHDDAGPGQPEMLAAPKPILVGPGPYWVVVTGHGADPAGPYTRLISGQ